MRPHRATAPDFRAFRALLTSLYAKLNIPSKNAPDAGKYNSRCKAVWHSLRNGILTDAELERLAPQVKEEAEKVGVSITI